MTPEEREHYSRKYSRAREVLCRLKSCEAMKATTRAVGINQMRHGPELHVREWVTNVRWALTHCGLVGATVLVYRTTRQQKSQANSFVTIGRELGLSSAETELIFDIALAIFIDKLDTRRIPDSYRDEFAAA